MHSKIINPRSDGRFVFANRGSCRKTVSYLGHEAREETQFFNDTRNDIKPETVRTAIDSNAKGLRKQQEKFYSLVLSPSEQELQHLQNDPQKLRHYTRQVMENYAANFTLQDKNTSAHSKRLCSSDLVWFATMHQERKEKEGAERGTSKTGLHQHVHILVSAQDETRQYRLNPRGRKSHFVFKQWQVENGKTFQQMFDYQKATTSERLTAGMPEETKLRHQERIRYRVVHLNQYFVGSQKLDAERALSIGKAQEYGKGFFFNLHRLTKQYQEGKLVNNPYHVLETGKDEPLRFPERMLFQAARTSEAVGQEMQEDEANKRKKQQTKKQLDCQPLER